MKIAIAQLAPVVGAFDANVRQILSAYERACAQGARVLLTPELGICGYPPHDLTLRPEMFERNEKAVEELLGATRGKKTALLVGHIARNPRETGRAAQNVVTILEGGKRVFVQAKSLLPTYDIFDEARYFEPASQVEPWVCDGVPIAVGICEDFWQQTSYAGRRMYDSGPLDQFASLAGKLGLVVSISASPFEWGKRERREKVHAEVARRLKAPLVYVNQVGANDEILFDGASFALAADGALQGRLPVFSADLGIVSVEGGKLEFKIPTSADREDEAPAPIEELARGLVIGIRDYFTRTGFKKAILGLSGGIDSAVVAALACRALGPENVLGVAMPSQYSSAHSLADAEALARNLGMRLEVRPIKFAYSSFSREVAEQRGGVLAPLAQENLQSRLRGLILMTLSNHDGSLVLTTGNKSELATGYCTLYGDMAGALAPLGDVLKTRVYALARHLNATPGVAPPIPERTITKAPSAELKPNQTDQDTLPPYEDLDALLEGYLEKQAPLDELEKQFKGGSWVRDTLRRLELNEYKRRQAAPVLKISPCAFGIGRRIPIAKSWG